MTMKSAYNLPLTGECESHQCGEEYERCRKPAKLYRIVGNDHLEKTPWEQYSCEKAIEIDRANGFESIEIDGRD